MFAVLVIEREPVRWQDLPAALASWVQDAGGIAAAALVIWLLIHLFRRPAAGEARAPWLRGVFTLAVAISFLSYLAAGGLNLLASQEGPVIPTGPGQTAPANYKGLAGTCLTLGGAAALLAVGLPFWFDLARLRWRRIWALAKVSLKEAVRRKVLWVFSALLLVFLFASWFLPYKPEDQVRNYVTLVYSVMAVLLILAASLLASFSIPTDVRNQTIHTIVTKPVERFEIVLGRFLGYMLLMTAVLIVMTGVSLLYVLREINPDARFESMRARVPLFGELGFLGGVPQNVGYEWDYRQFIPGGQSTPYRAIWSYRDLPRHLSSRQEPLKCEFSFEIFRTTKGEENKGVFCTFTFQTWRWDPALAGKYAQEREQERSKANADPRAIDEMLAEKYGYYELRSKEVVDYHTLALDVPVGIFHNALERDDQRPVRDQKSGERVPAMQILVKCESPTQYVGMARRDLYVLDTERPFAWNFFKGAVGLWFWLCLVIGIAVAWSTYLSGVVTWLATMFLFVMGFFQNFIQTVAAGKAEGGGPMEALVRLAGRESLVTPLEQTATNLLAQNSDVLFRWWLRRFLDIVPDVESYDLTSYVAEGFNIAEGQQLLLSFVLLCAYLLPWAIAAYYMIKSREIATW